MRLIDADALKQSVDECDVCNVCPERKARCSYDCEFPDHLTPKFEALIDAQPTIEPKRGEWKLFYESKDGDNVYKCSCCRFITVIPEGIKLFSFCPNCGADMREREGE